MTRSTRLRPRARLLLRPFQEFADLEASSGILLLVAAAVALLWANSPMAAQYFALRDTTLTVDAAVVTVSKPLLLWINDGLMAIFFFVVGLEIKREVLVGELREPRRAALSVAAAAGGMLVPAAIYAALNAGGPGADGWAIPMATDIAFVLGALALLGPRVPLALKVFVTAVAIVDDLGAVIVIALFYTAELAVPALGVAGGVLLLLVGLNLLGVRRTWPYAVLGVLLWLAVLKSGLHATIAGVVLAMTIPARRAIDAPEFLSRAEAILDRFRADLRPGEAVPTSEQQHALYSLEAAADALEAPLQRLEHGLHPWVAYAIIPVFALANAGVSLSGDVAATLAAPTTLGVILGLVVGKQVGIASFAWLAVRTGIASLPSGVGWGQIWGVSLLCGIGFTMSLFIASLAFAEPDLLNAAKVGILVASVISGLVGGLVLVRASRVRE